VSTYRPAVALSPAPRPARAPWPGRADVVAQVLLQAAIALVLAAVAVNWLDVFLDLFHTDPEKVEQAVRTWLADVVALAVLTTAGVVHSLVRRGRAGRWPVTVACLVLPAVVLGCPLLAG
jgi:hypothetical protein